jgi:PhnB protein
MNSRKRNAKPARRVIESGIPTGKEASSVSKSKRAKGKDKKGKKGKGKKAKLEQAKTKPAKSKKSKKNKPAKAKAKKDKPAKAARSAPQVVTPYLAIRDAAGAIEFYCNAFDAVEMMRLADPSGKIGHAEIEIGGARIMLADEHPEMDVHGPEAFGGSPVSVHVYLLDVDAVFERAVAAGAKPVRPPADQFYGDRAATLIDPFGHRWHLATRVEEVSAEEMEKRYAKMTTQ